MLEFRVWVLGEGEGFRASDSEFGCWGKVTDSEFGCWGLGCEVEVSAREVGSGLGFEV